MGVTKTISARTNFEAPLGPARRQPGRAAPPARPSGRARDAGDALARSSRAAAGEDHSRATGRFPRPQPRKRRRLPALARALKEFLLDIRPAQNMLVLKTPPSGAQPLAAAVDAEHWKEVAGTLAGDDTVLIICSSRSACARDSEAHRGDAPMSDRAEVAVVGATGYAGFELARLLLRHPHVEKPTFFLREATRTSAASRNSFRSFADGAKRRASRFPSKPSRRAARKSCFFRRRTKLRSNSCRNCSRRIPRCASSI